MKSHACRRQVRRGLSTEERCKRVSRVHGGSTPRDSPFVKKIGYGKGVALINDFSGPLNRRAER